MPNRRHLNRIRWLGGLVLVLALLAHDALMASVAHATPESPRAFHDIAASLHTADDVSHMVDHEPAPAHPQDCSTTGGARPAAGLDWEPADVPVDSDAHERPISVHSAARHWVEPLWPPGVRRALLQVYRI